MRGGTGESGVGSGLGRRQPSADLLADLPAMRDWRGRPLPRRFKQLVHELDEQTLMSLIAYAVDRLDQPSSDRKLF